MVSLPELLANSAALHGHLCPRQVLGVRMGIFAAALLNLDLPQSVASKRLLTIVETDGCFADGVAVATNCWVGRRTMRIEDYGKVAATFVDTCTGFSARVAPRPDIRLMACAYVPEARNRWEAMLLAYQCLPMVELFAAEVVQLKRPLTELMGKAGARAMCALCSEEILNERGLMYGDSLICRACAGYAYYSARPTT